MNEAAAKLAQRVVRAMFLVSAATSLLIIGLIPGLLLLDHDVATAIGARQLIALAIAALASALVVSRRLEQYRYLLRALAFGSRSVEPSDVQGLGREPGRLVRRWIVPHILAEGILVTPLRPTVVGVATGTSFALLGGVVVAAASLVLYVVVRNQFLKAMELAPPEVMREVIDAAERSGTARFRIQRRIRTAVATPVALVAIGSALVVNAHVRRADENSRETTARTMSRAALELGPGVVETAGIDQARARAESLGFSPTVSADSGPYALRRGDNDVMVLTTPLDMGTALVRFHGSTVPVLGEGPVVIAVVTVLLAAALGSALGRAHAQDLEHATEGIRLLGTEAVLRGGRLSVRPPRFQVVFDLEQAIERLAERFRVFARAQERAILAREAATRTRGLFFASVSHDLKSPLNAVLGFAELVRWEPLTPGQAESLAVIERRGRELLALIETILDAARVEAGQLSLFVEPVKTSELLSDAFAKARDLGAEAAVELVGEVADGAREIAVDRIRMARALATLVAFAVRQTRLNSVRVRAVPDGEAHVLIEIEIAGRRDADRLARMIAAAGQPGAGEHRGLALGLSLSRSIVELHKGTLRTFQGTSETPVFAIRMPLVVRY